MVRGLHDPGDGPRRIKGAVPGGTSGAARGLLVGTAGENCSRDRLVDLLVG
ncbi:hypothetical protein CU044_2886 [Streptomyces sp. L-9-10]|nr:hypothetical protein CU044_2886 [Streptomyces sp. L-9-10]